VSYSLVQIEMYSLCEFSAIYSRFEVTSGKMMSLPGHFRSPGHVMPFHVMRTPPTASYSLVGSEMYSIR